MHLPEATAKTSPGPWGRATLALAVGAFVARAAYLFGLCEWELLGDEALYWDCARLLRLGHYKL